MKDCQQCIIVSNKMWNDLTSPQPWVSDLQKWPQTLTSPWTAETNFPLGNQRITEAGEIWKWIPWPYRYWTFGIQILWSPVKYACQPGTPEAGLHFRSKDGQHVRIHGNWMAIPIEKSLINPRCLSRGKNRRIKYVSTIT